MFDFLAFITNGRYWQVHSWIVRVILRFYGIHIGKSFHIRGIPKLKINGQACNITIGNDVMILGNIDLRNRENGRIRIGDNVVIEQDCRFVAARNGEIFIGNGTSIGSGAIFNGGGDIRIGNKCLFGVRTSINANDHLHSRQTWIRAQGFVHAPVIIEDDCWLGANVCINKGVSIRHGSIVGANAVVTKDTEEFSINAGVPARKIGDRPQ